MEIYVAHSRAFDFRNELYLPLRQSLLNKEHNLVLPHESGGAFFNSEDYIRKTADLLVAEVSEPSTGLGIELGWANAYGVPIILVYREGSKLSKSLGAVANQTIEYGGGDELVMGLEKGIQGLFLGRR